jgi:hypothetical protein
MGRGLVPPQREHKRGATKMLESMSAYYPYDESPTDPDELIWGRFTEEEWDNMTCEQRAEAIWSQLEGFSL